MQKGICRLCNSYGELTYEHVPPMATFNKRTRFKVIPFMDYVNIADPFNPKFRSKIEQGGVGYYSLCGNCNSFLGTHYVDAYSKYSNSFVESAQKKEFNAFEITMHDFEGLKVLKQIISMFLSINNEDFSKNYRELADFVLIPNSQNLPARFRVFNYLNIEGQLRNLGITVLGNFETNITVIGSELTYPPLGHVLTIDFNGQLPFHQEITLLKQSSINDLINYTFKMYKLPTHLPFFLDYRSKEEISNVISNNKE